MNGAFISILTLIASFLTGYKVPGSKALKNILLGLAFPLECFITAMYWTLKFYDKSLLMSQESIAKG